MNVPFPLFPARFPFPRSLPEAVSGVCDLHKSPSFQVCAFPSLLLPSPCSLPCFPIDDYVPCPVSLLTIMFPSLFPVDDHVPTLLSYFRLCSLFLSLFLIVPWHSLSWCPYVTFTRLLKVQFYVVSTWVNGPDNYYLCTELCSIFPHYF